MASRVTLPIYPSDQIREIWNATPKTLRSARLCELIELGLEYEKELEARVHDNFRIPCPCSKCEGRR